MVQVLCSSEPGAFHDSHPAKDYKNVKELVLIRPDVHLIEVGLDKNVEESDILGSFSADETQTKLLNGR